jgi:rRNA processing protein Gar1
LEQVKEVGIVKEVIGKILEPVNSIALVPNLKLKDFGL